MNLKLILSVFLFVIGHKLENLSFQSPPGEVLDNNIIKMRIQLPNIDSGYYRATRFDWSGIISNLEYSGHQFIEKWFDNYSPFTHDAVTGPVDSFEPIFHGQPDSATNFIVIGVGALKKTSGSKYNPFTLYEFTRHGNWSFKKGKEFVQFTHKLDDSAGYSYKYTKVVRLTKNLPRLILEHTLINTGSREIKTNVFNHNFFIIDNSPTNPDIKFVFPYPIKSEGRGFGTLAKVNDNELTFLRRLGKDEQVYSPGLFDTAIDNKYSFKIENQNTKAGINVSCNRPLQKLVFWACATTACPEPYVAIDVKPGQKFTWTIKYDFYSDSQIHGKLNKKN